jgi:hypothetical protein
VLGVGRPDKMVIVAALAARRSGHGWYTRWELLGVLYVYVVQVESRGSLTFCFFCPHEGLVMGWPKKVPPKQITRLGGAGLRLRGASIWPIILGTSNCYNCACKGKRRIMIYCR